MKHFNETHGHSKGVLNSATYESWHGMKGRCNNPKNKDYKNYGARGIQVCARWASFTAFLEDMGEKPEGHLLDRKDNDGNYTFENCRWATPEESQYNRRRPKNNTSGLKGVSWITPHRKWKAYRYSQGTETVLYKGPDFFEACCARKSWESKQVTL